MPRRLFALLVFVVMMADSVAVAFSPVNAAIVVNAKTGEIIYSYNADRRAQPASLAKMMTLLLTFKALRQKRISPLSKISVSSRAASQQPCTLRLKKGQVITVRNAILALITKSANDVAVALAEHIGKSESRFVEMMNKEARRLGMSSTLFLNPSGWKNPRQLTTVRDMAKLSRALLTEYPGYYHLFATRHFCFNNKCIKNHNHLLGRRGEIIVDGIKTGFVNASGYNLAASATKGKTRLIAIVFGGRTRQQRDAQVSLLLRKGFSKLISRDILAQAERRKKKGIELKQAPEDLSRGMTGAGIYNKICGIPRNSEEEVVANKINNIR